MTTALIYLVVMVVVAAVVFLLAAVVFGRGEQLAPLPPGATPTRLPAGDIDSDDVRDVRFQQSFRGYKMSEVDWVLDRLATELGTLRDRVAELEALHAADDARPADRPGAVPPTGSAGNAGPAVPADSGGMHRTHGPR